MKLDSQLRHAEEELLDRGQWNILGRNIYPCLVIKF